MTFEDWISLVIVLICLLVSAFFSGSETALTASSRASMARLEKQGNRDASIVNRLLAQRERLIGALMLGNNAVNIGASSLDYGARFMADPAAADVHMMTGNTLSVIANRLSYHLDLHGPSFTVDTACSSSLVCRTWVTQPFRITRRKSESSAILGSCVTKMKILR